jgi:antitoxin component YwqK of YwqJK toxin-antitoxin module
MSVGILIEYYIDGNFTESEEVKNSKKDGIGENHDVELNIMGDS